VPSVRFIESADRSMVRLRTISDPLLLLIRAAIIACAVLAVSRPLLLTDQRVALWGKRTARAVLIESTGRGRSAAANGVVAAQLSGADPIDTLETDDLRMGLRRAARWLAASPPVRREIVVISDFRRGVIDAEALAQVPDGIGIRFARVSTDPGGEGVEPISVLDGNGALTVRPQIEGDRTSLSYSRGPLESSGLRIIARPSSTDEQSRSLLRVVGRAGAFAPAAKKPITIQFGGQRPSPSVTDGGGWSFGAAQRLLRATSKLEVPVSVSSPDGSLVVHAPVDPEALAAAQILQATLDSRVSVRDFEVREPERIDDGTLTRWTRPSAAPGESQWRQSHESDGRWLWVAALVLLTVEAYLRRSSAVDRQRVLGNAA
jgi:hypothetical protein